MHDVMGVPLSFTWEIFGDTQAHFNDCFRMFNPLTAAHLEEVCVIHMQHVFITSCRKANMQEGIGPSLIGLLGPRWWQIGRMRCWPWWSSCQLAVKRGLAEEGASSTVGFCPRAQLFRSVLRLVSSTTSQDMLFFNHYGPPSPHALLCYL